MPIIERRGARTALIATEGFRDVARYRQREPLRPVRPHHREAASRWCRARCASRCPSASTCTARSAWRSTRRRCAQAARSSKADGIESVAVAFMHSYVNPAHERRTRGHPEGGDAGPLSITLSSEVCPEMREYERTSTAVANAYVQPLMDGYLARMDEALRGRAVPRHDLSRDLGRRPHRDRHGAALSGAADRIRARPAARSLPRRSRRAPARRRCCRSTWAAPRPRSA